METTPTPDEGMTMLVPVGGGLRDGLADILPGLEAAPFVSRSWVIGKVITCLLSFNHVDLASSFSVARSAKRSFPTVSQED